MLNLLRFSYAIANARFDSQNLKSLQKSADDSWRREPDSKKENCLPFFRALVAECTEQVNEQFITVSRERGLTPRDEKSARAILRAWELTAQDCAAVSYLRADGSNGGLKTSHVSAHVQVWNAQSAAQLGLQEGQIILHDELRGMFMTAQWQPICEYRYPDIHYLSSRSTRVDEY